MDIKQMQREKYFIILEALLKGLNVELNKKNIFYYNKFIYETYYSKSQQKQIIKKSNVSLQTFLNFFKKINNKRLKKIYGDIKLFKLAKKIINDSKREIVS